MGGVRATSLWIGLVPLLVVIAEGAVDPCTNYFSVSWDPRPKMVYDDFIACLNQGSVTGERIFYTLATVRHGIANTYGYTDIAANSTLSKQTLAPGCMMPVHRMALNISESLDGLRQFVMASFGLPEDSPLETLLSPDVSNQTMPAKSFHSSLAGIFRGLNDAHTLYVEPWAYVFPLYRYFEYTGVNSTPAVLRIGTNLGGTVIVKIMRNQSSGLQRVMSVGPRQQEPFSWLKEQADVLVGNYKSLSARVNSYLNSWGTGIFNLLGPGLPHGEVVFNLDNGENLTLKVVLDVNVRGLNFTLLNRVLSHSPAGDWNDTKQWLTNNFQLSGAERESAIASLKEKVKQNKPLELEPYPSPVPYRLRSLPGLPLPSWIRKAMQEVQQKKPPTPKASAARRLAGPVIEISCYPSSGVPIFVAYVINTTKLPQAETAVVFKMTSFETAGNGSPEDLLELLSAMLETYHQMVSQSIADRLILDLTDNGGGIIDLANLLTSLIAPRLNTTGKLCSLYQARMSQFWRSWLVSFDGGIQGAAAAWQTKNSTQLMSLLNRVMSIQVLSDALAYPAPVDFDALGQVISDVQSLSDEGQKRSRIITALQNNEFLQYEDLSGDSNSGWFPFTGDVSQSDGSNFSPRDEPYLNQTRHTWGPTANTYSDKYTFACSWAFDPSLDKQLSDMGRGIMATRHQWKQLAILTNGLCGSACALIATTLTAAEGATVFSYGGVPGEVMDTTAFAGGNVLDYNGFWSQSLYAGIIGDILAGPNTPIGQRLRAGSSRTTGWAETLLLPLPSHAITRFNFNMMNTRQFGPDALPREWYVVPAHRHYKAWFVTDADLGADWGDLSALYVHMATENWTDIRLNPGFDNTTYSLKCFADPPSQPWSPPSIPPQDNPSHGPWLLLALGCLALVVVSGGGFCVFNWVKKARAPGLVDPATEMPRNDRCV